MWKSVQTHGFDQGSTLPAAAFPGRHRCRRLLLSRLKTSFFNWLPSAKAWMLPNTEVLLRNTSSRCLELAKTLMSPDVFVPNNQTSRKYVALSKARRSPQTPVCVKPTYSSPVASLKAEIFPWTAVPPKPRTFISFIFFALAKMPTFPCTLGVYQAMTSWSSGLCWKTWMSPPAKVSEMLSTLNSGMFLRTWMSTPNVGDSNIEFFHAVGLFENLKITSDTSAFKIHDLYLCECPSQIVEVAFNMTSICQVQDLHLAHVKTFNWTPNFGTIGQVQHSQPVAP